MDILRRNTDYALRAMVNLAKNFKNGSVSTKTIAEQENISYQLACKLMQKLHNARLLKSYMGPKGGFSLRQKPSKITLLHIIKAIQGPIRLNRCLLSIDSCSKGANCPVRPKLAKLQNYINEYLNSITLEELSHSYSLRGKKKKIKTE